MTPVRLEWWDARGDGGWIRHDELPDHPCVVHSVGFLMPTTIPGHLTVVQSIKGDHNDNRLHVPIGMVRRIVALVDGAALPVEPVP